MQLWTEYEGKTVAGAYTLGKLLRSEGRNGFFATSDTTGNSAVIRITEAHYDEDDLLKRWRQVAGMHQTNLIEIERVGQTSFDGVEITYALMEPTDANLGDVLAERPLTAAEATQVAKSVVAAVSALHASGLVHEHIEPVNVLAVGDVVKLRSDCVRECIADIEFNTPEGRAELCRRDIHDLGVLMLQCITLEKQITRRTKLPEPFLRIIPGALDGTWTLEQISLALDPAGAATKPAPSTSTANTPPAAASKSSHPAAPESSQQGRLPLETTPVQGASSKAEAAPYVPLRARRDAAEEPARFSLKAVGALFAAVAIIVILVLWHFLGGSSAPKPTTMQAAAVTPTVAASPAPTTSRAIAHGVSSVTTAANAPGWYVIAYTYNHENQAAAKAAKLNANHSSFHAEVFGPHGRAPYLISLGGPMSESEAKSLEQRARHSGMPRDTYIHRY
jgi:hypothetical protein